VLRVGLRCSAVAESRGVASKHNACAFGGQSLRFSSRAAFRRPTLVPAISAVRQGMSRDIPAKRRYRLPRPKGANDSNVGIGFFQGWNKQSTRKSTSTLCAWESTALCKVAQSRAHCVPMLRSIAFSTRPCISCGNRRVPMRFQFHLVVYHGHLTVPPHYRPANGRPAGAERQEALRLLEPPPNRTKVYPLWSAGPATVTCN
jgi:hypothetical protein